MNTAPITITITSRPRPVVESFRKDAPTAGAKLRHRYRAEFTSGRFVGLSVDGFSTSEGAIGALVRAAAEECHTPGDVIDFVAALFDTLEIRTANEAIGRAVRFASRHRERRHAGLTLRYVHPENRTDAPAEKQRARVPAAKPAAAKSAVKGGVA